MITEQMLDALRENLLERMGERRFAHTLGVERMAARLGEAILPSRVSELRAAALLHDVAKEIPLDEQLSLLAEDGYMLTEEDRETPGVIHSFTAPIIIRRDFPEFATKDVLLAVENHTVGTPDMSVFEKIIFISDYIEDTRTYESCINVRGELLSGFDSLSPAERLAALDGACLSSINGALSALERMNKPINSRMYKTKNSLLKN